jgi:hypothetical protein
LGEPALSLSIDGVDEWRYCSSTVGNADEFAVIYFRNGVVVDKGFFTIQPYDTYGGRESCLANIEAIYLDRRRPPRRVEELRAANRK